MCKTNTVARLALLACASLPFTQAATTAPFNAWLDAAERNAPRILAAQAAVDAATANTRAAGAWANPEIAYTAEDQGTPTPSRTVELRQRIELGGKIGHRQAIAQAEARKASLILRQAVYAFRASAYQAYGDLGLAELRVQEARLSAGLAQDFSTTLDKKLAAGRVPPVEAAKARLPALLAEAELKNAESQHRIAISRLESLLGQPLTEPAHAMPSLPEAPQPWAVVREHARLSPQVLLAQAEVDIQAAQLEAQRAQSWPDLIVAGGVKRTRNDATQSRQFGITLDIPLFSRQGARVASAVSRGDQANAELRSVSTETELALQSLHAALQSLSERIRLYQETIIPTAQQAYRTAQQGFELGRYGFIDVLDAQRSLLSSRTERTSLWQQYLDQQSEYDRILGRVGAP